MYDQTTCEASNSPVSQDRHFTDDCQAQDSVSEAPCIADGSHEVFLQLDSDNSVLHNFCERCSLTPSSVLQTAWAIVISCYAGVEEASFVYGANNNENPDLKPDTYNICHTQITPNGRLLDIISATKVNVHGFSSHDVPSDAKCLRKSDAEVTWTLSSGLYVDYRLEQQASNTTLDEVLSTCHILGRFIITRDAPISVSISAHASKFSITEVNNMAHTLEKTMYEILGSHPESLMADLDVCSQRDLKKILSWNQSTTNPIESCFHWDFEKVAQKVPDAPAICSWDGSFTYQELDTASTKLANHLRHLGVRSEVFVGICFNKTSTAYVCMLSILKAGGAFVAIDPSYPSSRIQTIVDATKASIFIAEQIHCCLFEPFNRPIMAIDTKTIDKLPYRPNITGPQPNPSNIAYAVFTSGSTGVPKGIMIEHRSLCTATRNLAAPMHISSSSRVLQFAAYTFDVSYGDTFITLAQGGCICVPSENERINDLPGAMSRMSVNNACLIPSVARMIRPEDVPYLKVLLLGGEALVKNNLDVWAQKVTLSVVYGPSECTVWCASQTALRVDSPPNTIGRGIGALLWITDATNHNHLCPIGSIGELLIEGPGLARGYLDEEQTKSAFIENPTWAHVKPGQCRKFYKTGDLVRYQPNGSLSFIGRKDTQIKLHGRRIELGEIEYHLSCHDLLRQSMVLFPSAGRYREKLVAVIVFKATVPSGDGVTGLKSLDDTALQHWVDELTKIKSFLSSRLPLYMVPQEFIAVEKIPLMTSGKMNRVLSKRFIEGFTEAVQSHTKDTFSEDQIADNIVEDRLRRICSQVLDINIEDVGVEDSFASLGGDSFIAMDFVARCKAEGYNLTVADILHDSTILQIASKAKTSNAMQEDDHPSQSQYIHTVPKPLVLRPAWWNTEPSSVVVH